MCVQAGASPQAKPKLESRKLCERQREREPKGHEIRTYDCVRASVHVCVCVNVCVPVCSVAQKRTNKLNETRRENHKQIIKSATRNRRTEAKAANITLSSVQHIHVDNTYAHIYTYKHTHTYANEAKQRHFASSLSPRWQREMIHGRVYQQTRFMSCLSCSDCACQGNPNGSQARGNTRSHTHTNTHTYTCIRTLGTFVQTSRVLLVGVMSGNMSKCNGT